METSSYLKVAGLLASAITSTLFSSAELTLSRLSREEIKRIVDEGGVGANRLTDFLRHPRRYLGVAFIVKGCSLALAAVLCYSLIHPPLLGFLIAAGLIILLAEVIPRSYAERGNSRAVVKSVGLLKLSYYALFPLVKPLLLLGGLIYPEREENGVVSNEELEAIQMVTDSELLEKEEREMIHRIWELPDTLVKEIMVPRTDMVCLDVNSDLKKVLEVAVESGHSRIPVYKDTIDNIIGVLYVKDLLKCWKEGREEIDLAEIVREPYFVPESKRVNDLFREMRLTRRHIAIVVDEYGGTAGMVTMEDILEEIVGEIRDEYDLEEERVREAEDGSYLIDARIDIHELNDRLGLNLPTDEDVESIGGLLVDHLGRVPRAGEVVEIGGVKFTVLEADERRISKLRIEAPKGDVQEGGS